MNRWVLILCVLVFGNGLCQVESVLKTTFIEDLCYNTQHSVYDLRYESSGVLMSAPRLNPHESFECEVVFSPPKGASVVISIYRYDLYGDDVLVIEDSDRHRVALMGYGVFKDEKKSVISEGKMRIFYKTGNKTSVHMRAGFQFTFTKVTKSPCSSNEFKCNNGHCVLKDYICDGHNHCGDNTDQKKCDSIRLEPEVDPRAQPYNYGSSVAMWISLMAAAILIVGSVIVIAIVVVLVRRAKLRKAKSKTDNPTTPQVDANSVPLRDVSSLHHQQASSSRPLQSVSATVPHRDTPPPAALVHGSKDNSMYNRVRRSLRGMRTHPGMENVPKEHTAPERHQIPSMYPSLDQIPSAPAMYGVVNPEYEMEE